VSRDEKDISHIDLPDVNQYLAVFTLKDGTELSQTYDEQTKPKEPVYACAKTVTNLTKNTVSFFVRSDGGSLYNPRLSSFSYEKRKNWQWKKLHKQEGTFNFYVKFLQTNRETDLRYAERSL
jgi:hypothetical protein